MKIFIVYYLCEVSVRLRDLLCPAHSIAVYLGSRRRGDRAREVQRIVCRWIRKPALRMLR